MLFYKIDSADEVIDCIAKNLKTHLEKKDKVLWLLSGGSAIDIEVKVARYLTDGSYLNGLTITLIDERYGLPGHRDSNYQQLLEAGFDLPGANFQPVLSGANFEQTIESYRDNVRADLESSDFVIGLAGIGADGHTLGIEPKSPAVNNRELAMGYRWEDYERLTLTAQAIKRIDLLFVYAVGLEKKSQLAKLKRDVPADEQPAQLLKLCPNVIIFSDQIGVRREERNENRI